MTVPGIAVVIERTWQTEQFSELKRSEPGSVASSKTIALLRGGALVERMIRCFGYVYFYCGAAHCNRLAVAYCEQSTVGDALDEAKTHEDGRGSESSDRLRLTL